MILFSGQMSSGLSTLSQWENHRCDVDIDMRKGVLGAYTMFIRCKSTKKYVLKLSEIVNLNKFWVIEQNIDIFYP